MSATLDARAGVGISRRLSGHRRRRAALHPLDDYLCPGTSVARGAVERLARRRTGQRAVFSAGRARNSASRRRDRGARVTRASTSCRCTDRSTRTSRIAALRPSSAPPHHRRDEHRRNVADGARRDRGRRRRPAQGRALRRRARHRQPRARADHRGRRGSARRPRRRARRRGRAAAVGRARSAAAASRAGHPPRRSGGAVLDVIAWGGDPRTLEWFERPRDDRLPSALALLERLGAFDGGTVDGRRRARCSACRCIRVWRACSIAADGAWPIAQACALLSERHLLPPRTSATTSDLLSAIDRWSEMPSHVKQSAQHVASASRRTDRRLSESDFRRAVFAGYPDRVASGASRSLRGCCYRQARVRRCRRRAEWSTESFSSHSTCVCRRAPTIPTLRCASPASSIASGCSRRVWKPSIDSTTHAGSCTLRDRALRRFDVEGNASGGRPGAARRAVGGRMAAARSARRRASVAAAPSVRWRSSRPRELTRAALAARASTTSIWLAPSPSTNGGRSIATRRKRWRSPAVVRRSFSTMTMERCLRQ